MASLEWRPRNDGLLEAGVTSVVVASSVLAVLLVGAAGYGLGRANTPVSFWITFELGWQHLIPPLLLALLIGCLSLPPSTTSRSIRVAVLLPFTHALALVIGLLWIGRLELPDLAKHVPLLESLPVLPWFFSGLGLALVLAWAIGGRREWTHAFVMFALAFLLLFALWLPLASLAPVRRDPQWATYLLTLAHLEAEPGSIATLAIAPPFVIAALYTWLAIRSPHHAQAARLPILIVLGVLGMISLGARTNASVGASVVHDNFTHLLLAAMMLAIVATVTLSLSTWFTGWLGVRRLARGGRQREFTVSDDGPDEIAMMEIAGWLRGPRVRMRSFIASDGNQELRVPAGARILTSVPKHTRHLLTGEQVVLISSRDRLKLGGLVAREVGDSPFRSHQITELGPGLVVERAAAVSTPTESMLLTSWRPSIAYLIIVVVAAIPSLAGLVLE